MIHTHTQNRCLQGPGIFTFLLPYSSFQLGKLRSGTSGTSGSGGRAISIIVPVPVWHIGFFSSPVAEQLTWWLIGIFQVGKCWLEAMYMPVGSGPRYQILSHIAHVKKTTCICSMQVGFWVQNVWHNLILLPGPLAHHGMLTCQVSKPAKPTTVKKMDRVSLWLGLLALCNTISHLTSQTSDHCSQKKMYSLASCRALTTKDTLWQPQTSILHHWESAVGYQWHANLVSFL